ncbi:hypothetical protein [Parafrankia discariae]|uniref:hypothetical protein n=1 Tax=Parafrankia discariae TaxID=365528 RepID=UPI0003A2F772|nr:hypothetical protein [Parafrankia discariae]
MMREVQERTSPAPDPSATVPPPRTHPTGEQPPHPAPTGPPPAPAAATGTTTPAHDPVAKAASRYRRSRRLTGITIGALLLTPGWTLAAVVATRYLTGTHLGTPWYTTTIALAATGTLIHTLIFASPTGALLRERPPYDRVDDLAYHYLRVGHAASTESTTPPTPELLTAAGRAARRLSVTCPHSASRLKAAMLAQRYFDTAASTTAPGRPPSATDLAETLETTHRLLTSLRPV